MTLKLSEIKEFYQKLIIDDHKTLSDLDLKKLIGSFWNIATEFAINERINALLRFGFIRRNLKFPRFFDIIDKLEEKAQKDEAEKEESYLENPLIQLILKNYDRFTSKELDKNLKKLKDKNNIILTK